MDVTHYPEFGTLKFVHRSVDAFSGFARATALSSEKADAAITHLLEAISVTGRPAQLKTDNGSAYISHKFQNFLTTYSIAHTTGIPYNSTGRAIVERADRTLEEMLAKQKGGIWNIPRQRLNRASYTLIFLNRDEQGSTAARRHWAEQASEPLSSPYATRI